MAPLFPHVLRIQTPGGPVDWAGYEIPPEAMTVAEERQTEVLNLLDGRGLARSSGSRTLRRLRIASPDGFALPGPKAVLLKALNIGAACTITENLTDREALTVWTNALVWAAPVVTRLGYDAGRATEYYGYQLEFIQTEI